MFFFSFVKSLLVVWFCVMLSSCFVHRHTVGDGPAGGVWEQGKSVRSTSKQIYILAGLVPIGRAGINPPSSGNYQIKTSMNIVDMLISGITFGVLQLRTVKVIVWDRDKLNSSSAPNVQQSPLPASGQ